MTSEIPKSDASFQSNGFRWIIGVRLTTGSQRMVKNTVKNFIGLKVIGCRTLTRHLLLGQRGSHWGKLKSARWLPSRQSIPLRISALRSRNPFPRIVFLVFSNESSNIELGKSSSSQPMTNDCKFSHEDILPSWEVDRAANAVAE